LKDLKGKGEDKRKREGEIQSRHFLSRKMNTREL